MLTRDGWARAGRTRETWQICHDLELHGLVDDDNGMELLVDNHIVGLSLPVKLVYEQVWRQRHQQDGSGPADRDNDEPMRVVFRLQGLDGALDAVHAAAGFGRTAPAVCGTHAVVDQDGIAMERRNWGALGEATEERVDTLEEQQVEQQDPEKGLDHLTFPARTLDATAR